MDRTFDWDREKNERLRAERGVSFEAVVSAIAEGNLLDVVDGKGRFAHQKQFIVEMGGYAHVVPFVEHGERTFLKTIIPSRKMTKRYFGRLHEKE